MAWRRGQAYGQDLRDRVLACPEMSLRAVASRFGVSPTYVSKVRARRHDLGEPAHGPARIDLNHFLSAESFRKPLHIVESAWLEHAPFAFWLMDAFKPRRIVELGTHRGFSYFVFCQAVRDLALTTRCFAVDTWQGDAHAGLYGEGVYQTFRATHDPLYADFSCPIRATFAEAAVQFEDGSIDLLHLDGRHGYDDIRSDFETWRAKLSSRAIILLHDTNVRKPGFGVWRFWKELSGQSRSFEFLHGYGLGVLGFGDVGPSMRSFFKAGAVHADLVRDAYRRLAADVTRDAAAKASATAKASLRFLKPPTSRAAPHLHIHTVSMAPSYLDVRTHLPLRELAKIAGVGTSISMRALDLPDLPANQPKILIMQRLGVELAEHWRDAVLPGLLARHWVVVAELDDHPSMIAAVHNRASAHADWDTVRLAHGVQTSTARLGEAFRAHNPTVAVFENSIFTIGAAPVQTRDPHKLRVFYGALNRQAFSGEIAQAFSRSEAASLNIEFVVLYDRTFFDALGPVQKSFYPAMRYDDYLRMMATCDVMLAPLKDSSGESYKSDLKFLEASSQGLATIASPLVYGETIRDGETGLIARTDSDWPSAVARLRDDPGLQRSLANAAYDYVATHRLFSMQATRRIAWYQELWNRRQELTASLLEREAATRTRTTR